MLGDVWAGEKVAADECEAEVAIAQGVLDFLAPALAGQDEVVAPKVVSELLRKAEVGDQRIEKTRGLPGVGVRVGDEKAEPLPPVAVRVERHVGEAFEFGAFESRNARPHERRRRADRRRAGRQVAQLPAFLLADVRQLTEAGGIEGHAAHLRLARQRCAVEVAADFGKVRATGVGSDEFETQASGLRRLGKRLAKLKQRRPKGIFRNSGEDMPGDGGESRLGGAAFSDEIAEALQADGEAAGPRCLGFLFQEEIKERECIVVIQLHGRIRVCAV